MRFAPWTTLTLAMYVVGQVISPRGTSLRLNGIDYFAPPSPPGKLQVSSSTIKSAKFASAYGFIPITVVADKVTRYTLDGLFFKWTTQDDVWQPGFLGVIILTDSSARKPWHATYQNGTRSVVVRVKTSLGLPSGPYFFNTLSGEVHQAYRLYDDFSGSFMESLLQLADGTFQTLAAHAQGSSSLTTGVPSRLYFTPTKEKPLAGVRIGVKDLYDLAGVKSSRGNRAWYNLYPTANKTAPAIQNLIDAGAIIVGTQKMSQFANGQSPTADWVSYHAPFNPRGDGYQDPSSSSSGAGASVASYERLDLAVGSDTGGFIRGPAGNSGIFGKRPTHDLVSLDNVMPLSPTMDTTGFLARDPYVGGTAQSAMYGDNYTTFSSQHVKYPQTVYTLGFPANDTARGAILHEFASDLAAFLGTVVTEYDIDEHWASTGPKEVRKLALSNLLNSTYSALITKEQIPLVREPFFRDYAAAHDGRLPFIDPTPRTRWGWADTQPDSILDDAIKNKTLFMNWFNKEVFPAVNDPNQCTTSILLHTVSNGGFGRRDTYFGPPKVPFGWSPGRISIFSEAPDSVFSMGEIASLSEITQHDESLPVTVDVMVARGCDGLIPRLAQDLVKAKILSIPKTRGSVTGGPVFY